MYSGEVLPHRLDDKVEFHLNGPAAVGVGVALATVMLAPLPLFLSKRAGLEFLAVQLGFIGAVYFGFAVADGSIRSLLVEFPVSGVFLALGAVTLWAKSPPLLAAGYLAHAVWDLVHHPRAVPTPVRSWYPPFCVVFDLVVAGFILVWLPLGKLT